MLREAWERLKHAKRAVFVYQVITQHERDHPKAYHNAHRPWKSRVALAGHLFRILSGRAQRI